LAVTTGAAFRPAVVFGVGPERSGRRTVEVTLDGRKFVDEVNVVRHRARRAMLDNLASQLNLGDVDFDALDQQLLAAVEAADVRLESLRREHDDAAERTGFPNQATRLTQLAADADLRHTAEGKCFARVTVGDHKENWLLGSDTFANWLKHRQYRAHNSVPSAQAILEAVGLLEAKAIFDGEEAELHVRLAEHNGRIYLDLCNENWQVVEISPEGWEVIDEPPVFFRRGAGMLPLPAPERGGNINELRRFVNVGSDTDFVLLVAYLVASLNPAGPFPILIVQGQQGSSKTTLVRAIRELTDPHQAAVRNLPRDERDLAIAAANSWLMAFDNLSHISNEMSDTICRFLTGIAFAKRQLYSDEAETLLKVKRPFVINGIEDLGTRSDLLDRAIVLHLPVIEAGNRQTEVRYWADFAAIRPRILGCLLDALSAALRNRGEVHLDELPRMADVAVWVTAAGEAFRWSRNTFVAAYNENRRNQHAASVEASPVAMHLWTCVERLTGAGRRWLGTATDLLKALENLTESQVRPRNWPQSAKGLSDSLRRAAPNLKELGISLVFNERAPNPTRARLIEVTIADAFTPPPLAFRPAIPDDRDAPDVDDVVESNHE
jgi:CTP:molybdopterin cytidylyltransferase MocA